MRVLFFLCLVTLWCKPLFAAELRLIFDNSETWIARVSPEEPETEWEVLALKAVVAGPTARQDRLTATYVGKRNSFDIVTVEEAPESIEDGLYGVKSFEVCEGKICGDTHRKYVSKPNPENEQMARSIAMQYLAGARDSKPQLHNGKMYVVEYDGKCLLTVIEKDRETVFFRYQYDSCR